MRELQILFNNPMVRAILGGKKTQTRRPFKNQPPKNYYPAGWCIYTHDRKNAGCFAWSEEAIGGEVSHYVRPPYQKDDILYVGEAWRIGAWHDDLQAVAVDYEADNFIRREWIRVESGWFEKLRIESTDEASKAGIPKNAEGQYHWNPGEAPTRWRKNIVMPEFAARIILKVTNVRVERVHDITDADIKAEGVSSWTKDGTLNKYCVGDPYKSGYAWGDLPHTPIEAYKKFWSGLYEGKSYGWGMNPIEFKWENNPWVWVIEFEIDKILDEAAFD